MFGTVPFLTSILGTMLPMLTAAKHDTMRGVFCYGKSGSPRAAWALPAHSLAFCLQCPFAGGMGPLGDKKAGQVEEG